jgi:hypothetical protein
MKVVNHLSESGLSKIVRVGKWWRLTWGEQVALDEGWTLGDKPIKRGFVNMSFDKGIGLVCGLRMFCLFWK